MNRHFHVIVSTMNHSTLYIVRRKCPYLALPVCNLKSVAAELCGVSRTLAVVSVDSCRSATWERQTAKVPLQVRKKDKPSMIGWI